LADRAALVITVDSFFEAGPPVPYAAADGAEFLRILPAAGYDSARCRHLSSHQTTRAALDSFLRRLPKMIGKPVALLVLIVTRGFTHRGRGYLACADTLNDDLTGTSLPVADLLDALHRTRIPEIAVLLDIDPLAAGESGITPGLDEGELRRLFDESPSCVGLLASEPGERSFESAELRRGIWRHHLIEAFTGKSRIALTPEGALTAAALHELLADEVPRTLARTYERSREQSPVLLGEGHAGMFIAEVGHLAAASGAILNPSRMNRLVFRSESIGRVKDLAGYRKSHSLPDRANEWARKFVNRLAAADIKADLDRTYDAIRETFGYKRKEIEASAGRDGTGFIRTPDFEYTVSVAVNPDDPTEVIWRREVGRIPGPAFVRTEEFAAVFGPVFDTLVFEFAVPIDVASFVDRMEDQPPEGVSLSVASGSDEAEVKLAGFTGRVTVTRESVVIEGRSGATAGLLDRFLSFLGQFEGMEKR
jgi:hypothetical protein